MSKLIFDEPAFPVLDVSKTQCGGMSLRDWFAGQALAGLTAGPGYPREYLGADSQARVCYVLADAMLIQRHKPTTPKGEGE